MKYLLLVILALVTYSYLNFTYSRIYKTIDEAGLKSPYTTKVSLLTDDSTRKVIKYVALGDSLTAGVGSQDQKKTFPYVFAQSLEKKGNVVILVNLSQSGAKSKDVLQYQVSQALQENPDYITLLIGINDIHSLVQVGEFEKNFQEIVKQLNVENKAKIIILNLPYLGSGQLVLPPYSLLLDFQTKRYNDIIQKVASSYNLPVVDLYTQTKNNQTYSADQFHPSGKGYILWGRLINAN